MILVLTTVLLLTIAVSVALAFSSYLILPASAGGLRRSEKARDARLSFARER